MTSRRAALALIAALALPAPARAGFDEARLARAVAELEARAGAGRLGVGVMDLRDGRAWHHRGDERFPLQSVVKLPGAWAAFRAVDAGRLGLDQTVTLTRDDLSVPPSPVVRSFRGERLAVTVRALVEGAVQRSDNTAFDVLLRLTGGPGALTEALRAEGVAGLRIDRPERDLQMDALGLGPFRPALAEEAALVAAIKALPEAEGRRALRASLTDPRDTATPRAMVAFLARLARGEGLRPDSARALLAIMARTVTGAARLKAGVPPGSTVAHKTGTARTRYGVSQAVNDVGLVTLPDGRRFAIAVFLSGSDRPGPEREALIAGAARAAVEALD